MQKPLLTNKVFLIALGVIAIVGLVWISYNATQNTAPVPTPTPLAFKPKTATLAPPVKDKPVTGQLIVKFKPQYTSKQINTNLGQYHASIIKTIEGINQTVIKVPAGQEDTILKQLQSDPYVLTAQRDYTTHALFTPDDQGFSLQYGLNNSGQSILGTAGTPLADIHAEKAWDVTRGNGVKVAILDTGINLNQPDLAGKIVLQKSFVSNSVEDGNGHGTHVAGIIAADTDNGIGVAGTCPNCQLLIGKVLEDNGSGATSNTAAGIIWAADNGAKVINLSLGTTEEQTVTMYEQAVAYALQKGAVIVAAAGNDGTSQFTYPAAVPGVISVAGTDNNDKKASWSDFGTWVDLAAPGKNILSTSPTHAFELEPSGYDPTIPYVYLSGTSMATPFVSGVAALIATTPFGTSPQAITNRLFATADKISGTGTLWRYGRVDAALAVGTAPTVTSVPNTNITPALFCVGGNAQPPCATIPPAAVTLTAPAVSGTNPSVSISTPITGGVKPSSSPSPQETSPSPSISSAPINGTPSTGNGSCFSLTSIFYNLNPVTQKDVSTQSHHGKRHHKGHGHSGNGFLSQFFAFLLRLLELLLQLIFHCTVSPGSQTPAPSPFVSPSPSVSFIPSISGAISPSTSPNISTTQTPSLIPPSSLVPTGIAGTWKVIFNDEFNGTSLDTSKWAPYWFKNGATQNKTIMQSSNVNVSGGNLNLTVTGNGGGLVSTNPSGGGHFQFTYGAVEARIFLPASGNQIANWPAWWTDGQNWPTDGEIDVMEGLKGLACYHFHDPAGGPGGCVNGNWIGWHIFGADWEHGVVTYYYDGKRVGSISSGITSTPMYLILENSHGSQQLTPATMKVDYVRVWQKG